MRRICSSEGWLRSVGCAAPRPAAATMSAARMVQWITGSSWRRIILGFANLLSSPDRSSIQSLTSEVGVADRQIDQLLDIVARAYDRRSWHGTNLRGSIRGLAPAAAAKRPRPGRHNIWELVVHAAYWKYAVRRRLTGQKRGSFPLDGSNFFKRPV